jgi:pimeloyl-ACP methyl ester carboxylesterase
MRFRNIVIIAIFLAVLVGSSTGQVPSLVPLPADLQGAMNGVPYRIRVPANWNGTLLVYAHGYTGQPIPALALLPADVTTLLSRGFALAASKFGGTGWNVKEGLQNTANLTAAFREMVGHPQRTIMWGGSMGGLMALGMIEKFPGLYDGAIALCPPAAGTPRRFDLGLDIALAYAVAFGWNPEWGTPGDIRDDLNFSIEVLPYLPPATTNEQIGRWEFIRLVNKMPKDSYYAPLNFRVSNMNFAMAVRAELEHRAGGPVAENIGRVYALSDADKATVRGFGVEPDVLLAQMNANTIYAAYPNARNYVEHYVNPTGRITRPVITLHTKGDSLAIPGHESAYRAVVEQKGNGNLLVQQFTDGIAHCYFTSEQDIAAVDAMMHWLDTGNRPDASFFTAPGFLPGFVPEPWAW